MMIDLFTGKADEHGALGVESVKDTGQMSDVKSKEGNISHEKSTREIGVGPDIIFQQASLTDGKL